MSKEYTNQVDDNGVRVGTILQRNWKNTLMSRSDDEVFRDTLRTVPSGVKSCAICLEAKALDEFYRTKYFLDGYARECSVCDNLGRKLRYEKEYVDYWEYMSIPLECYICGDPWEHSDHVVPKKLEGVDDPYNRLPICGTHNSSKYMHPLREWLKEKHPDKYDEVIHRVTVEYGMEIDPTPRAH